jgi:hypothetical protein
MSTLQGNFAYFSSDWVSQPNMREGETKAAAPKKKKKKKKKKKREIPAVHFRQQSNWAHSVVAGLITRVAYN